MLNPVIHDPVLDQFRVWDPVDGPLAGQAHKYVQGTPAAIWSITHNLGTTAVEVIIFNALGERIFAAPDYAGASTTSIAINFTVPVSGTAYVRSL
jgi:hypothetical protein